MKERLASYAPFILVGVYPLGMALQNIGSVLALLFLLPLAWQNREHLKVYELCIEIFSSKFFIFWMLIAVLSTLLNGSRMSMLGLQSSLVAILLFSSSHLFLPSTC